jgi:hypothetical protein
VVRIGQRGLVRLARDPWVQQGMEPGRYGRGGGTHVNLGAGERCRPVYCDMQSCMPSKHGLSANENCSAVQGRGAMACRWQGARSP